MLNQYTLNGGNKRGRVNTQDIWRYNEWTSFAGVERLFWRSICPVLVLFHRTCWAVHIYKDRFLKCHFLPVSLLSLLPTIMDGSILHSRITFSTPCLGILPADTPNLIFIAPNSLSLSFQTCFSSCISYFMWECEVIPESFLYPHTKSVTKCFLFSLQVPLYSVLTSPFSPPWSFHNRLPAFSLSFMYFILQEAAKLFL